MTQTRKKFGWRLVAAGVVAIALAVAGYVAWLRATYIDELVEAGGAYGLVIGQSKSDALSGLPSAIQAVGFEPESAYFEIKADQRLATQMSVPLGYTVMVSLDSGEDQFGKLLQQEQWDIYFDRDYKNLLRLTFCGEHLCEIYRHRKNFELP